MNIVGRTLAANRRLAGSARGKRRIVRPLNAIVSHDGNMHRVVLRTRVIWGVLAALIVAGATWYWYVSRPIPLDQAQWRAVVTGSADEMRSRMAEWLIDGRALVGKSKNDVMSLLGPPTDTDKFREYDLVYWVGRHGIDSEWLVITMGPSGTVAAAKLVTD
jgi:hypothetical protein